jgi:Flp pilus assembly secretin CpaC
MTKGNFIKRVTLTTTVAAVLTASIGASVPTIAAAQSAPAVRPANDLTLSVGTGRMVRLNGTMSDLFVADDRIADVRSVPPTRSTSSAKARARPRFMRPTRPARSSIRPMSGSAPTSAPSASS